MGLNTVLTVFPARFPSLAWASRYPGKREKGDIPYFFSGMLTLSLDGARAAGLFPTISQYASLHPRRTAKAELTNAGIEQRSFKCRTTVSPNRESFPSAEMFLPSEPLSFRPSR